jgi:ribosomal protein L37AE/L43A
MDKVICGYCFKEAKKKVIKGKTIWICPNCQEVIAEQKTPPINLNEKRDF